MTKLLLTTAIVLTAIRPSAAHTLTSTELRNCLDEMYQTTPGLIDIDIARAYADKFPTCKSAPVVGKTGTEPTDQINRRTNCIVAELGYWERRLERAIPILAPYLLTVATDAIKEKCR